MLLALG